MVLLAQPGSYAATATLRLRPPKRIFRSAGSLHL
jgi:hypothetical protein